MSERGEKQKPGTRVRRRDFLKLAGAAALSGFPAGARAAASGRVVVLLDAGDAAAASGPVRWAAERLCAELAGKGATANVVTSLADAAAAGLVVVATGPQAELARGFKVNGGDLVAEGFRLAPGQVKLGSGHAPGVLVSAIDTRGFVYGLLELAERVRFGGEEKSALSGLRVESAVEGRPANETRSVGRYFCCELEDKPWYYDKEFWRGYLDTLVASRFNRFCLAFGLEYDFPRGVTDDYFHLPYPYLVDVTGYADVRVVQLKTADGQRLATPRVVSGEERARNLAMLKFIAAETGARGLDFQLGIWTHAYAWTDSPEAYHRIEGLTAETHAPYCRDALAMLLRECPEIKGLTLRVHGESGVPEGSYDFWRTLFEAVKGCGRKVELDMHAKGVNQTMIDMGLETGMPVKLGAKFSAEHQSLGYQQADIRALETRGAESAGAGPFSVSSGTRPFTRYGYADFLSRGAQYKLWWRLWPGTQRHLLSCDAEMAAAYGRAAHFCGAAGLDICEPLTFKGREGSGAAGGRCAYADESLTPAKDWQKFELFYRVWGRKLYDPEADGESWRRAMRAEFGRGAGPVEMALGNASRMLPLVTSAHLPSASNHSFWPEMYTNMPVVLGEEKSPYSDTPSPKCFGTVSPLDPQLFSTVVEYTHALLAGWPTAKYSPIEVAQWLEDLAKNAEDALESARVKVTRPEAAEFRRVEEDVLIQIGLGRFFAKKLRTGALYEIWQQTRDAGAGTQAMTYYKDARAAWAAMAERAKKVYRADIGYGDVPMRRGHWADRLAGIDGDITAMHWTLEHGDLAVATHEFTDPSAAPRAEQAVQAATGRPVRPSAPLTHEPVESFVPGSPMDLVLTISKGAGKGVAADEMTARLRYRHVDQAERWQWVEMEASGRGYKGTIPGDYTHSAFGLEYYFEMQRGSEAWLVPGFNATLSNQPYFAVWKRVGQPVTP
jgi:hypothetical protein